LFNFTKLREFSLGFFSFCYPSIARSEDGMSARLWFYILICLFSLLAQMALAMTFDADVSLETQKLLRVDLRFIYSVQGTGQTQYHEKVFGKLSGANYQRYFESHVKAIGMDPFGDGPGIVSIDLTGGYDSQSGDFTLPTASALPFGQKSLKSVAAPKMGFRKYSALVERQEIDSSQNKAKEIAAVIPTLGAQKMWLTENFVKASYPQIARLMILFHEARHAEPDHQNWSHARCPIPFLDEQGHEKVSIWSGGKLSGEEACDDTAFGSYGTSSILLHNISRYCSNCSDKMKMDADVYALDQAERLSTPEAKKALLSDFSQ
jgi:hypothetical protein